MTGTAESLAYTPDEATARVMVQVAYGTLDMFGDHEEMLRWARGLRPDLPTSSLIPGWFDPPSSGVLAGFLRAAGVIAPAGTVDRVRLYQFQSTLELLPHIRQEEAARAPAPRSQVVFTVPPDLRLDRADAHLQRSLFVRVSEALVSAQDRVLLASPFWSDAGTDKLYDSMRRATELRLPVVLAGAKRDPDAAYDWHAAMLRFANRLRADGANVTALEFVAPPEKPRCLFHAKLVCGRLGYLGSANLTDSALGEHVEAGIGLDELDVEKAWWLIGVLRDAGMLVETGKRDDY